MSAPQLVDVTTETKKTRHLARPEDLKPFLDVPGRFGQSLCKRCARSSSVPQEGEKPE